MVKPDIIVPDVFGEILGWRAWDLTGTRQYPILESVSHGGFQWKSNAWTVALCGGETTCTKSQDGRVPGEDCSCGLYCARSRPHLADMGYNEGNLVVIGRVALIGKVIPGDQGWRGAKGRIAGLFVPPDLSRYVAGLERRFACPVIVDDTTAPQTRRWVVVPRYGRFYVVDKQAHRIELMTASRTHAEEIASLRNGKEE